MVLHSEAFRFIRYDILRSSQEIQSSDLPSRVPSFRDGDLGLDLLHIFSYRHLSVRCNDKLLRSCDNVHILRIGMPRTGVR